MKTELKSVSKGQLCWKSGYRRASAGCLLLALTVCLSARAAFPEPDNIVYGHIWLGSNQVTAADARVVVVVVHPGGNESLASYQMGSDPALGDLYAVTIHLGAAPILSGLPPLTNGTVLDLVVQEAGLERIRTNFMVGGPTGNERGYVQQLDLGVPALTGFSAWLASHQLEPGSWNQDNDLDGYSNFAEFLAGTDPTNSASRFVLRLTAPLAKPRLSFRALQATGIGYEGRLRHYALEWLADLKSSSWQPVPGYEDIGAANQEVLFEPTNTAAPRFFRGRIWLTP